MGQILHHHPLLICSSSAFPFVRFPFFLEERSTIVTNICSENGKLINGKEDEEISIYVEITEFDDMSNDLFNVSERIPWETIWIVVLGCFLRP